MFLGAIRPLPWGSCHCEMESQKPFVPTLLFATTNYRSSTPPRAPPQGWWPSVTWCTRNRALPIHGMGAAMLAGAIVLVVWVKLTWSFRVVVFSQGLAWTYRGHVDFCP